MFDSKQRADQSFALRSSNVGRLTTDQLSPGQLACHEIRLELNRSCVLICVTGMFRTSDMWGGRAVCPDRRVSASGKALLDGGH